MAGVSSKATIAKGQAFSNSIKNSLMLNLVSEWRLDDASGTAVSDQWGSNPGAWSGSGGGSYTSPSWRTSSECVSGGCLAFDGTDDYVNCGNGESLRNHTFESIFVWASPSAYTATYRTIVDTGYWGASYGSLIDTNPSSNSILIVLKNSAGTAVSETIFYNPNTWIFIGFSWNGSTVTYYKNGVSSGTPDSFSGTLANNGNNLFIGGRPGNYFFGGLIDDVRIYNAAIPTSQVQQNYYSGLNRLLSNRGLADKEYLERISQLKEFLVLE